MLALIANFRQDEVLVAVDLKAENVGADVVRLAEKHKVLPRLLFIGTTISDGKVRDQIKAASRQAQTSVLANSSDEFAKALADPNCDWVYVRYLPGREQVDIAHRANKRVFIAGPTVAGELPENWSQAAGAGVDGILTDYPLELRTALREQ